MQPERVVVERVFQFDIVVFIFYIRIKIDQMENKELLKFLLETIKKYPNDKELGDFIRTHTHRFLGELEKEQEIMDALTDEEVSLLESLRRIQ